MDGKELIGAGRGKGNNHWGVKEQSRAPFLNDATLATLTSGWDEFLYKFILEG